MSAPPSNSVSCPTTEDSLLIDVSLVTGTELRLLEERIGFEGKGESARMAWKTAQGWLIRCLSCLAMLGLLLPPAAAQETTLGNELRRFLHDDATAVVHVRSYFFDRVLPTPPSTVALAGGGWVGLRTGWFYDSFQLGVVGYTTQPLWAPQNKWETSDGTRLLKKGGYGYFTLGQAFASARYMGQTFTGYRQLVDELEVNPWDNRMIPATFEAYAVRGRVFDVSYFAGYVAAMKPRDYSAFINMAEQAAILYGTKPGTAINDNRGMWLASLRYADADRIALRGMYYMVPDILWSTYYDAVSNLRISDDVRVRLSGQLGVQGSNGANLLTGTSFGTFMAGLRADVIWGPLTFTGAYQQIGSAAEYRHPYGVFIGFNKQQVRDFRRAGETSFQAGARYDFASVGLPGLTFFANAVYGHNAVNAMTGARLSEIWEYDLDLRFSAQALPVPDWMKSLQLRGRVAFVDQYLNNNLTSITEYRVILNYTMTWQGSDRK